VLGKGLVTIKWLNPKQHNNRYTEGVVCNKRGNMWWADPGWRPGARQAALSLPHLTWTGGDKIHDRRLVGRGKNRERSLTIYLHGQNRLNSGKSI